MLKALLDIKYHNHSHLTQLISQYTEKIIDAWVPYLLELKYPVPRPNFEGCFFSKKSKHQYIISVTHEYNLV